MRMYPLRLALLLFFATTLTTIASAQTGTITGQVLDSSGAVIPGATVTALSSATGSSQTAVSSSAGVYSFGALPPATYNVTAEASGFQPVTKKGVVLNVAATLPENFTLSVAGGTTTVDVQDAAGQAVETDSFQLSTVIDSKQINDMPLVLRDPYQLVLLSPGVVSSTNNDGGISVNGQRDRNNNFMLDGADNNDTSVPGGLGGISTANPDSTQEFRVITNNFDAEFGRNTGAVVDVITRSGTNTFHGDAYEFGRYNALGARDFFNTKANGPQDPYVRNDFGASLGGPIRKDHTFFFLNGEAQRFRTARTTTQTTPTAAFKTGVFDFIDPNDGSVTHVDLTNPADPNNLSGLPADPKVMSILSTVPVGQTDNGDGVSTTLFFPVDDALNSYTLTGHFDHKLSSKHQLSVRYIYGHSNENDPFFDDVLPGSGKVGVIGTNHNGVINITSVLSATMTNQLRGGFNMNNAGFVCDHARSDALTGVDQFGNGADISFPYFFTLGCAGLGDTNAQSRLSSTLTLADTFQVVKGAHSLKFGAEWHDVKDNDFDNFSSRDAITLNTYTNYQVPSYNIANPQSPNLTAFEDLVWGAQGSIASLFENQFFSQSGTRLGTDYKRFVQHEWAAFAQDTWKVNPHLTAILGLRYAFNGVPYETNGQFANFYGDASAPLPASGIFTFRPVGPGTGHQLYEDNYGMIEPRIGFAYDLHGDGKTAIRGGYGIFHDRIFDNLFGNARANPPFQAQLNDFPFDGTGPLLSGYTAPGNLTPSANIGDESFYEAVTIDPKLKMPTNQSWNIGVQRQLSRNLTVEVNYVGSHTTHALREIDGDPPQPALVQAALNSGVDPSLLQFSSLYYGNLIGLPYAPVVYNTAFFHDLIQTGIVNGNYNGLQAKLQGEYHGLNVTGSYSWAHALDNGSDPLVQGAGGAGLPRNSFDLGPEYGNSDSDVRQRGTAAVTYNLPFGTGSHHLSSGLIGHVLEGIEIAGIQQAQTGLPFDLRGTIDNLHTSVTDRPMIKPNGKPYPSGRGRITSLGVVTGPSADAFENAPFGQSVSIHRNKFYGPSFTDTDAVFQKTQTVLEGVKLVMRVESYNVLNHPNFAAPVSDTFSSALFGISQSQVGQNDGTTGARQIQGALKVIF